MRVCEVKFMPSHHQDIILNSYPLTKRRGQWQLVKATSIQLERIKQTGPEINLQNLGWQQNNRTPLPRFLVWTLCQCIAHKVLQQLISLASLSSPEHEGPKPTSSDMAVFTFKRPRMFVLIGVYTCGSGAAPFLPFWTWAGCQLQGWAVHRAVGAGEMRAMHTGSALLSPSPRHSARSKWALDWK